MKQYMIISLAIILQGSSGSFEKEKTVVYANFGDKVVLVCKVTPLSNVIWRRENHTLSVGININPKSKGSKRYKITGNHTAGEFNLEIYNTTVEDFGNYWCDEVLNKTALMRRLELKIKDRSMTMYTEITVSGLKTHPDGNMTSLLTSPGLRTDYESLAQFITTQAQEEEKNKVTGIRDLHSVYIYIIVCFCGTVLMLLLNFLSRCAFHR